VQFRAEGKLALHAAKFPLVEGFVCLVFAIYRSLLFYILFIVLQRTNNHHHPYINIRTGIQVHIFYEGQLQLCGEK